MRLMPRLPVPPLSVDTVGGGLWTLGQSQPERFTLVVIYRGLHCPICRPYLSELNRLAGEFAQRGVEVIAISCDGIGRAAQTARDWKLDAVRIGYGLSIEAARDWGLYISSGRGKTSVGVEEAERFAEPALFLVRPDGTLYFAAVQTMPFARPHFSEILAAIDFVVKTDYPARGEV